MSSKAETPVCCDQPMKLQAEPLSHCTEAPHPEMAIPMDDNEPCNDGTVQ